LPTIDASRTEHATSRSKFIWLPGPFGLSVNEVAVAT